MSTRRWVTDGENLRLETMGKKARRSSQKQERGRKRRRRRSRGERADGRIVEKLHPAHCIEIREKEK